MSTQPALLSPLTAHCFWAPKCQHTESGFDVDEVHEAMERHYEAVHREDMKRITGWFGGEAQ